MVILLLSLLTACAEGDKDPRETTPGDDSGTPGTTPTEPDGAHPLCEAPSSSRFPEDMGDFCPMGSNLDLCVDPSSDDCESHLCLWDAADPAGERAYCTVRCDPGDTSTCPDGYTCVRDGCEDAPICQRTELPSDGEASFVMEDPGLFESNYVLWWVGRDDDGLNTWMNSHGNIFQFSADGTGSHPGDTEGIAAVTGIVSGSTTVLFPYNARTDVLVRVAGGEVETRELDVGESLIGGFRGEDGTLYYAVTDSFEDGATFLRPFDPETLDPTGDRIVMDPTRMPSPVVPLLSSGFVGTCTSVDQEEAFPCVGTSPTDVVALPLPPFAEDASGQAIWEMRHSIAPDEVWWADLDGLAWWNGEEWIVEDEIAPYQRPTAVVPLGGGRAVLFAEAPGGLQEALYLDGTCWQPMHPDGVQKENLLYTGSYDTSFGQIRDDVIGYSTEDHDLVSIRIADFP